MPCPGRDTTHEAAAAAKPASCVRAQDESLHPALDEDGDPILEDEHADPAVLYRAGSSNGQPTTTPRLVVCDLPDAFGTLGKRGLLYRDEPSAPDPLSWDGTVTTAAQDRLEPNSFLQHLHCPQPLTRLGTS